jgi:hypothetical protein
VVVTPGARVVVGVVVIGALVGFPDTKVVVVEVAGLEVVVGVVGLEVLVGVVDVKVVVGVVVLIVVMDIAVVVTPGAKVLFPNRSHLQ